jgi:predicted RNase H-like nuclease (RuvC/YqgF family)
LKDQSSTIQSQQTQISDLKQSVASLQTQLHQLHQDKSDKQEQETRLSTLEKEVLLLKDMVRGAQTQIKSKDIDIQRLGIKIKRLEKEAQMTQSMHGSAMQF